MKVQGYLLPGACSPKGQDLCQSDLLPRQVLHERSCVVMAVILEQLEVRGPRCIEAAGSFSCLHSRTTSCHKGKTSRGCIHPHGHAPSHKPGS